ncbi:hypothetical protein BDW27_104325 [Nocardiopsis sp. L17-MgMaSL7]|nr:hypothetical protein BDW27_104325 [Nocardiopsis sp. L17-MgMaSL7]
MRKPPSATAPNTSGAVWTTVHTARVVGGQQRELMVPWMEDFSVLVTDRP